jgi:hypothetical protein
VEGVEAVSDKQSFVFSFSFSFKEDGVGLCETFGMSTQKMAQHIADIQIRARTADVPSVLVDMLNRGELCGSVLMVLASIAMKEILEETPGEINLQRRARG